jgi:hypothetical protein
MISNINELVAGNRDRVMIDRLKTIGLLGAGAVAIIGAVYAKHPAPGAILGAGGMACGMAAERVDRRVRLGGQLMETTDRIAVEAIAAAYAKSLSPQQLQQAIALPATTQAIELFDWALFNSQPDQYAHLAIVGPTGSGKSTLAEILCTMLGGITIAIAPHRKPGDFAALGDRVYCGGRNYGTLEDDPADFDALLTGRAGKVTAAAVVKAIHAEMDRRYELLSNGDDPGPMVNLVWDEILATLGEVPKLAKTYLLPLLREARKVRLRVIALPQDDQVESLDIKGQGAARANLTYVRLGKTAIAHSKGLSPDVAAWVASQGRPCLVEDQPAIVPSVGALPPGPAPMPQAIAPAQHLDDRQLLTRCWDSTIEVGHETIQDEAIEPTATQQELINLLVQISRKSGTISAADCQRSSRKFKAISPDDIRALFLIAQAVGLGTVDGDGPSARFSALKLG